MSEYFFPKLNAVEAMAPYRPRTTWSTGEVLEVDVESVLRKHAFLAAILDPAVFSGAHLGEWGHGIEWIDAELGSDNVYVWAKEQAGDVSHEMFGEWMHRNDLSLTTVLRPALFQTLPPDLFRGETKGKSHAVAGRTGTGIRVGQGAYRDRGSVGGNRQGSSGS
jgi:hypothetical protein